MVTASRESAVKRNMHTTFKVDLERIKEKQGNIIYTNPSAARGSRKETDSSEKKIALPSTLS